MSVSLDTPPSSKTPKLDLCLRALLLAVSLGPPLLWLAHDRSVWPWDPAWYGEVSVYQWNLLAAGKFSEWASGMQNAFAIKAPGIAWLGQFFVPLANFVGSIEDALQLSILAVYGIVILAMYDALRKLSGSNAIGCVAALTIGATPLALGLTHYYFVEPLQMCAVTLLLWIYARQLRGLELLAALSVVVSVGLLAKVSTPLYVLPIGIALFIRWIRAPLAPSTSAPWWVSATAGTLSLSATLYWYIPNLSAIRTFLSNTSSGELALLYGRSESWLKTLYYWISNTCTLLLPGPSILGAGWPGEIFALSLIAILGVATLKRFRLNQATTRAAWSHFDILFFLALSQIALTLIVFGFQINRETRYLLPLLPWIATLIGYCLYALPKLVPLFAVLVMAQWGFSQSWSFGYAPFRVHSPSTWLAPPVASAHEHQRLSAIVAATCTPKDAGRMNIIGLELPAFNANSASFINVSQQFFRREQPRCFYTSFGHAESNSARALARVRSLNVAYVAFLDNFLTEPSDAFNAVSAPLHAALVAQEVGERVAVPEFPEIELIHLR